MSMSDLFLSNFSGAIIDATADVDLAFFVGGTLIILGALFHFLLHTPCIRHKTKYRKSVNIGLDDMEAEVKV